MSEITLEQNRSVLKEKYSALPQYREDIQSIKEVKASKQLEHV
jgi:hypothetical protein